jgi:hypothetical protein
MYRFGFSETEDLKKRGISEEKAYEQLGIFEKGAPYAEITRAATVGDGINIIPEEKIPYYIEIFKAARLNGRITKFVPASGAATRMFSDLIKEFNGETNENARRTMENIREFPFYKDLENLFLFHNMDIDTAIDSRHWKTIIERLLYEKGLNYTDKPKALIKFTQYNGYSRTALEEHVYEGISLTCDKDNTVRIHFTFTEKYISKAREIISDVREFLPGKVFNIDFSVQKPSTDTIAVYEDNTPVKGSNNEIIFRPGGHGALIENLNDIGGDIVFIKNIDNIVDEDHRIVSDDQNKALCGYLIEIEEKVREFLNNSQNCGQDLIEEIKFMARKQLFTDFDLILEGKSEVEKRDYLYKFFNRPIRVCGMIKNTGEPGGGPFFAKNSKGESLQIIESSQVNMDDPAQKEVFLSSTHFNPVNIVCSLKDHALYNFDLRNYVDKDSYFISKKTYNGRNIKALELPGLWNGAMSDWITVLVEMPLETFCPAKTVNDLLKPERFCKEIIQAEIE